MNTPTYRILILGITLMVPSLVLAQVSPTASDSVSDDGVVKLDAFEVYSQSITSALDEKRASNTISNFITSDALGLLPDDTLGAALTRIPGVNVVNGDAVIRGVEGKLNSLQLDGAELPTAQADFDTDIRLGRDDRAFNVDSIPVEAVESVEVLKSVTADRDADAVGGIINVKTASAFKFKEPVSRYKVEYRFREQGNESGYGAYYTYANKLNKEGTVGLYLNASFRKEDRQSWLMRYSARGSPIGDDGEIKVPHLSNIQPIEDIFNDQRFTLTGTLDWKLSDSTELYFKPWINIRETSRNQYRYRLVRLSSTRDDIFFDDPQLQNPVSEITDYKQADEFQLVRRFLEQPGMKERQYRAMVGGETKLSNATIDYRALFGTSRNGGDEYLASWTTYNTNPNVSGHRMRRDWRFVYDNSNKIFPEVDVFKLQADGDTPVDPKAERWNAFEYDLLEEIRYQDFNFKEDSLVAEMNYSNDLELSFPLEFKAGGKVRHKSRYNHVDHVSWAPVMGPDGFGRNLSLVEPEFAPLRYGTFNAFDDRYSLMGPWVQVRPVWDFYENSPAENWVRNERNTYTQQSAKNYDASETISAAYMMTTAELGRLTAIGGLRLENTDVDYTWNASEIVPPDESLPRLSDVSGEKSYSDVFPSLVGVFRQSEQHVFRAAITKTLARPDYARLVPFDTSAMQEAWGEGFVNDDDFEFGNPDLERQTAWNYDLGYEWYYGDRNTNSLSVGLFRKELENFMLHVGFEREVLIPVDPFDPSSELELVEQDNRLVVNGAEREINGLEFSWHQSLPFLPSPFDGMGFVTNYTYLEGNQSEPIYDLDALVDSNELIQIGTLEDQGLTNQPEHIANVQLYWEKGPLNIRFAYQFVDTIKVSVSELRTATERGRFQVPRHTIDASLRWRISDRLQLFIDAKNLSSEVSEHTYDTDESYPKSYRTSGRQWVVGLSGSF